MTKLLIVSFNLVILFAYKLFFGGDVSVKQDIPAHVNPGESFTVEIHFEKGDREGFAKWQQKLPEGFIASSVETGGATFSFKNQEVKLIWMSLPEGESFSIKYELKTSADLNGEFKLSGKFSYIEENERKDVNVEEHTIRVEAGASLADETPVETSTEDTEEETTIAAMEESTEETSSDESEESTIENIVANKDEIKISREIKHLNAGNYEVTLKIQKSAFNSFGKVEEYLPPGYTASSITTEEGIFSFNNKVMKILWMTLPKNEHIEVKYALQSEANELDSSIIHGVFSFLDEDESKQVKLGPTKFRNYLSVTQLAEVIEEEPEMEEPAKEEQSEEEMSTEPAPVAIDNTEKESTENTTEVEPEKIAESVNMPSGHVKEVEPKKVAELDTEEKEEELVQEITNIPAPETSVNYKVQIVASHREVKQEYFEKTHNITEPVSIEYIDSWYKYTVGSYNVYKNARDKRNEIWAERNKINDAFVTAYNSGERISVQEALMISKQKWYK